MVFMVGEHTLMRAMSDGKVEVRTNYEAVKAVVREACPWFAVQWL